MAVSGGDPAHDAGGGLLPDRRGEPAGPHSWCPPALDDDDEEPWLAPPLVNRLLRLAAFQNPEFYSAQAMRLPTFGIPRIIGCAELLSHHVALPRGCRNQAEALLDSLGIGTRCRDERHEGQAIEANFTGTLSLEQHAAADALLRHDTGVLAATTAFGKTVVAASIIAARKTNTLVLVHRRQLLDQWIARLSTFLDVPAKSIGQVGGGKRKPGGLVDVAIIQSLVRKGEVDDLVGGYGHLVVDECHHLSAASFEAVARRCKAKYVLGLSATVARKDGHHPIIFMQCGPVRFGSMPALRRPSAPSHTASCLARPLSCRRRRWMATGRRSRTSTIPLPGTRPATP